MNILCPNKIPCIDDALSLGNFSSEAADQDLFFAIHYKNDLWQGDFDAYYACLGLCSAPTQEEANLCALAAARQCEANRQFLSHEHTCTNVDCYGTPLTYTVPAGTFVAFSQAQADAQAAQWCQEYLSQLCAATPSPPNPNPPGAPPQPRPPNPRRTSNDEQVGTALCTDGGRSAVILAGTYWGNSKVEANSLALDAANVNAGKIGCMTELTNSCCKDSNFSSTTVLSSSFGMVLPVTWQVVGFLPAGLSLVPSGLTATISGIPTATGSSMFRLEVTDINGNASWRTFVISVMEITEPSTLAAGDENQEYSQAIAVTGGLPPYGWGLESGDTLPAGLFLEGGTGTISGTPTAPGTYGFTIEVADQAT